MEKVYTVCVHCGAYIDPSLADLPISEVQDREGTQEDPKAPGDYNNICDYCNYVDGKRGYIQ